MAPVTFNPLADSDSEDESGASGAGGSSSADVEAMPAMPRDIWSMDSDGVDGVQAAKAERKRRRKAKEKAHAQPVAPAVAVAVAVAAGGDGAQARQQSAGKSSSKKKKKKKKKKKGGKKGSGNGSGSGPVPGRGKGKLLSGTPVAEPPAPTAANENGSVAVSVSVDGSNDDGGAVGKGGAVDAGPHFTGAGSEWRYRPLDLTLPDKHYRHEPAYRTLGERLHLHTVGPWFLLVALSVPAVLLVALYGLLPLGDPDSASFSEYFAFSLFLTPITVVGVVYVMLVQFLLLLGVERPFQVYKHVVVPVLICTLVLTHALIPYYQSFAFNFCLYVFAGLAVALVSEYWNERAAIRAGGADGDMATFNRYFVRFLYIMVTAIVFFFALVGYVFAYRYSSEVGQALLPLALVFNTFMFRKVVLSLTDIFPIEPAMLISSFLVESMEDMFQVMVYPSVLDGDIYWAIWFVNAFANAANLLFLTDPWFRFRIWIKAYLKSGMLRCHPHAQPEYDDNPDERGHSNNKPGYHRRQVRFYMWKIFSQFSAHVFYLGIAAILRFGRNRRHYPFDAMTDEQFWQSEVYVGANLVGIVASGVFGVWYVRTHHNRIYTQIVEIHGPNFLNFRYIAVVIGIIMANGMLAVSIVLEHNQIWYADDPESGAA